MIPCDAQNGNLADWCECGRGEPVAPNECNPNPANPPVRREKHYRDGTYDPRAPWVLSCRDYAYTAYFPEHEACDSLYQAGSGRGKATFALSVPRGQYDVFIEGRHSLNRNSAGAKVLVTSAGQTHLAYIDQVGDHGIVADLHGRYCLDGSVTVVMDSTVNQKSDSIRRVILEPVP